jgi:hypothetical protein
MLRAMNIDEALEKASRILEEEQAHPTLGYRHVSVPELAAQLSLGIERTKRPRLVYENPKQYVFESTNFALLVKIFSQIADADRASFVSALLDSVRKPLPASYQKHGAYFPSFRGETSTLALLAEFCIRTGYLKELLIATAEPKMPAASLAIMLKEIEEMVALNFNLFGPRPAWWPDGGQPALQDGFFGCWR